MQVLAVETYPDTSQLCNSRFFPETFQGTSLQENMQCLQWITINLKTNTG